MLLSDAMALEAGGGIGDQLEGLLSGCHFGEKVAPISPILAQRGELSYRQPMPRSYMGLVVSVISVVHVYVGEWVGGWHVKLFTPRRVRRQVQVVDIG